MAASNLPVPAPMEMQGDLVNNWAFFRSQWEDYEIATGLNKKQNKIRVATLRSIMGRECLRTFQNLDISTTDREDPEKSIEALENYFKPTRNEIYERYLFYNCDQAPQETVDQWVTKLRQLSKSCNFGTLTDSLLRDRIVLGAKDKAARARMFREKDVDADKAIDQLRSSEIATQQIQDIEQGQPEDSVQFARREKSKKNRADI